MIPKLKWGGRDKTRARERIQRAGMYVLHDVGLALIPESHGPLSSTRKIPQAALGIA